jgi:MFS family permease
VYTVLGALPMYLASAHTVQMQRDLGFGISEFGFLVSAYFVASSISSKRVGPRIDRDGPIRGFRRSGVLACGACALISVGVHRWELLAVLLAVAGIANSYGQIASNVVIASVVRGGRQGMAFSAKQAAVPLSAVVSGLVASSISFTGSWRWTYGAVAVLALLLAVAPPRFRTVPSEPHLAARRMTPALLVYMLAFGLAGGIGNSVATFTPDAAVAAGFSSAVAALFLTLGSILAIVSRVGAGLSADRRAKSGFLEALALLLTGVLGLVVLSQWGTARWMFVAGLVCALVGLWGWQGVVSLVAIRTIPLPAATSTGAIFAASYLGTVVVPPVVGIVAERY